MTINIKLKMQYSKFLFLLAISSVLTVTVLLVAAKDDDDSFRINKLNVIWGKAKHKFGTSKLKDLKKDLLKHQEDEILLKKMKATGKDKDGIFEATTRRNLLNILKSYSLDNYYDDVHPKVDDESHRRKEANLEKVKFGDDDLKKDVLKAAFKDKRLDKLWRKAEKMPFTQEQLMMLQEEFQNQQDKLDQHYESMDALEEKVKAASKRKENEIDNSLDESNHSFTTSKKVNSKKDKKETQSEKKIRLNENTEQHLHENYKKIKKNIEALHKKISEGQPDPSKQFETDLVNELWDSAKRAKFNDEELEELKKELQNFQKRFKKLEHFTMELEKTKIYESDNIEDVNSKHIKRRVKDLEDKIEKTHKSIEKKISKRREEL